MVRASNAATATRTATGIATATAAWVAALDGLSAYARIEVLYWLDASRRDLVHQCPASDGVARGTFSLRSPVRPNPIGTSIAQLMAIDGPIVTVRGLDCLDGTPLLDIKPYYASTDSRPEAQVDRAGADT